MDEIKKKKAFFTEELAKARIGREETEERSSLLVALQERQTDRKKLILELEQYRACDPQRLKELSRCKERCQVGVSCSYVQ